MTLLVALELKKVSLENALALGCLVRPCQWNNQAGYIGEIKNKLTTRLTSAKGMFIGHNGLCGTHILHHVSGLVRVLAYV